MNLASLTPVQFRLFALPSGLYTIQQLLDLTGANTISYLFQNIRALYQCFTPPTNPDDQTTISIDQHPFQARLSMIEPVVPSQRQASLTLVQGQLRALAPGARTIRQLLDLTGALTISDLFHNIRVLDPSFVEPIDLNSRTIIGIGQHPFLAVVIDPRRGENGREPATQWQSRAPVQPIFERPTIQPVSYTHLRA